MNRLPNWLRWLLFLPLSIIASIVVYLLVKLLSSLFESFFLFQFLLILPGAGFTGYVFVGIAAKLVPKYNLVFSILMALTYGILAGVFLTDKTSIVKILQMTSFETICLIAVGSIGAATACYHTYGNQKKIASESDNYIDVDQAIASIKTIDDDNEISGIKSDVLEKQVSHIMSEFDDGIREDRKKHIIKEKPVRRSNGSDESLESYRDGSPTPKSRKDVIIVDANSSDLDKEVLDVVSILDANIGESKRKPLPADHQKKISTGSGKPFDSYPAESPHQKIKEVRDIPDNGSKFSKQQAFQSPSELISNLKGSKRKESPKGDLLVKPGKRDKLIVPFPSDSHDQDLRKGKPVPESDLKVPERQGSQTPSALPSEKKPHKRKPAPKEEQSSRSVKLDKSSNVFPNELPEQKMRGEKYVQGADLKVSEGETRHLSLDLAPERTKPKSEVIAEDDLLIGLTETDDSTDALLEQLFEQELQPEKHVSRLDFEDTKKEVLQPSVESGPEIIESKREVLPVADHLSRPTASDKLSDVFPDDFSGQEHKEEKQTDSGESKSQAVQQTFQSIPEIIEASSAPILKDDGATETVQISESYQEETPLQEFDEDAANAKHSEDELTQTSSELNLATEATRSKQATEDDILITFDDLDALIDRYQDDSAAKELKKDEDIPAPNAEGSVAWPHETNKIFDVDQEDSFLRKFVEENSISFLDLKDSERELLQTTTELNFLITESKRNQFTKFVREFYKSKGEDEKVALINTEIFYLWCMMVTIFDFSIDSDFRKMLIKFFNSRTINLYLKWKEFTSLSTTKKNSIDFNNFTYYSNQLRANFIHLNSSLQNTEAEILFGKIVLAKILETMGNKKINVDRKTILMPVQAYYELKQRVIEILNNSTETICV